MMKCSFTSVVWDWLQTEIWWVWCDWCDLQFWSKVMADNSHFYYRQITQSLLKITVITLILSQKVFILTCFRNAYFWLTIDRAIFSFYGWVINFLSWIHEKNYYLRYLKFVANEELDVLIFTQSNLFLYSFETSFPPPPCTKAVQQKGFWFLTAVSQI